jgi:hypothetical protein
MDRDGELDDCEEWRFHAGDSEDVEQSERESDGESVVREGTPPLIILMIVDAVEA